MPIFLGLYYALQESIFLRLAPFAWINNMAAPDMLLRRGENIPFLSNPDSLGEFYYLGPYFNLLPLLAVALMIVQQKLMTPPAMDEQQEFQQKMMTWMMVFFGVLFYKVAAGLCVYFIASGLWGLAERKLLPKRKLATAVSGADDGPGKGAKQPKPRPGGKPGPKKGKPPAKEEDGAFQKVKDWWADVLKQAKKK
jgi:membrane protein insertase Oxa1/YidC/SpoIIIJ